MPERGPGTAPGTLLTVVDVGLAAGAGTARLARRTAGAAAGRVPRPVLVAGRVTGAAAARLAGDLPRQLGDDGGRLRRRILALVEARLLAAVCPVLDRVLDQVDLTALVLDRVDVDRVVAAADVHRVVERLDLTRIVLERVDLDRIAAALDVDGVARRLDVDAVAGRLDIDAVLDRVDLVGLADEVVAGIDLPRIIRESTGSVASDGLRQARTRSMDADDAVGQFVDRFRPRRRRGPEPVLDGPGAP